MVLLNQKRLLCASALILSLLMMSLYPFFFIYSEFQVGIRKPFARRGNINRTVRARTRRTRFGSLAHRRRRIGAASSPSPCRATSCKGAPGRRRSPCNSARLSRWPADNCIIIQEQTGNVAKMIRRRLWRKRVWRREQPCDGRRRVDGVDNIENPCNFI